MNSDANVNLTEIAKFEAIASRWWDMEGEFKPLHQINPVRLDWITDKSGGLFGKRILDIGCGGGILSESMARRGLTSPASTWARSLSGSPACTPWNKGWSSNTSR